jgi:hypothetical protein
MKEYSNKKTARIVAILIILAIASSLVSGSFLESLHTPDYLTEASANKPQVFIGVLLLLTLTVSVVSIPIVMFPIFKKYNERLALGYIGARIFEGISDTILAICSLLVLILSQEFVQAGSIMSSNFQASGALILTFYDWIGILENIPYCLGILMFSYLLYQSKLVPRWLAIWGFVGGALLLTRVPINMFIFYNPVSTAILAIPIILNELVLAGWLLVKGFKSTTDEQNP